MPARQKTDAENDHIIARTRTHQTLPNQFQHVDNLWFQLEALGVGRTASELEVFALLLSQTTECKARDGEIGTDGAIASADLHLTMETWDELGSPMYQIEYRYTSPGEEGRKFVLHENDLNVMRSTKQEAVDAFTEFLVDTADEWLAALIVKFGGE